MKKPAILILLLFTFCQWNCKQSASLPEEMVLEHIVQMPQSSSRNLPLLVLMHGLGSEEKDLVFLGNLFKKDWLVVNVRAPYTHTNGKYRWYELDRSKQPIHNVEEAGNSLQLIETLIQQLIKKYDVDTNRIVVGGFSQGGIMSYSMGLSNPDLIKGVAVFSGVLTEDLHEDFINENDQIDLNVFISHGSKDPVLPFPKAKMTKPLLEEKGCTVTFVPDEVIHTISQKHVQGFLAWMKGM